MQEGGLLSLEQVHEGGDTAILPLDGELELPTDALIPQTRPAAGSGTGRQKAAEAQMTIVRDTMEEMEVPSILATTNNETRVVVTAELDPAQRGGHEATEVVAVSELQGDMALHGTGLNNEEAPVGPLGQSSSINGRTQSESPEESLSMEHSSSPNEEEAGVGPMSSQAIQLLHDEVAMLEDQTEKNSGKQDSGEGRANDIRPGLNDGVGPEHEGETIILRSQLARARRHVKLYYTKVALCLHFRAYVKALQFDCWPNTRTFTMDSEPLCLQIGVN